jgi:endonuclease/exonuclease/phosphatase family metal-dependent hydrolase
MKLATYNFQLGGRRDGARHWQRLEDELGADIVFAQEAGRPPGHRPRWTGGNTVWRRINERAWGSAIVVRGKIVQELTFEAHAGWLAGCVAELGDGFAVTAISVHVPNIQGQNYTTVLTSLVNQIAAIELRAPLVIGGDFNVKSAGPRPVGDLPPLPGPEREIMERIGDTLGLVSCWESVHPGTDLPQTLRWSRSPEVAYHSDALFVPKDWQVESCAVLAQDPWLAMSDHFPVTAEVRPPRPKTPAKKATRRR